MPLRSVLFECSTPPLQYDVSRVEKLIAPQAADCTVMLVRPHDALAELALVQALLKEACGISPADFGLIRVELVSCGS